MENQLLLASRDLKLDNDMLGPNISKANTVQSWLDIDTLSAHSLNKLLNTRRSKLQPAIASPITYCINEHGFRSDNISDNNTGILYFGDGITSGLGVPWGKTWAKQISSSQATNCWNFGIVNSSNDTVYRLAKHWIPILKDKVNQIIVLSPDPQRLELLLADQTINLHTKMSSGVASGFYKTWWTTNILGTINRERNKLAVEYICRGHNISCLWINTEDVLPIRYSNYSRDLNHPGIGHHTEIYNTIMKQL